MRHERPEPAAIRAALEALAQDYAGRPIEIKETGAGFRIQVRRAYAARSRGCGRSGRSATRARCSRRWR